MYVCKYLYVCCDWLHSINCISFALLPFPLYITFSPNTRKEHGIRIDLNANTIRDLSIDDNQIDSSKLFEQKIIVSNTQDMKGHQKKKGRH